VHAGDVPLNKLMEFEKFSLELKKDAAVQEIPVQSFITSPSAGDIIALVRKQQKADTSKDGKSDAAAEPVLSVKVKGMAWSGGGEGAGILLNFLRFVETFILELAREFFKRIST
jgi:hypothetical protein